MKAGIDLGSTLIKVVYLKNKKPVFLSTANYSISEIVKILKQNKITHANVAGIGKFPVQFKFLKINHPKNLIVTEIKAQVKGIKYLNKKLPKKYILISIGTGISYTIVNQNKIIKLPIGSSIGGGTIMGLAKALGFKNFSELVSLAGQGKHEKTDIYFKDLIVSNLAKISQKTAKNDLAAGLMNLLAITVYKDLMLYKLNKQNIIIIGSTLNNNSYLKKLLRKYFKSTNTNSGLYFIRNSEYATCLGALLF